VKVFISYERESRANVRDLANHIQKLGHTVWFDDQLNGGESWWNQILEHVRECDTFVFALAPRTLDSVACRSEYEYAVALGKSIIPVLVAPGVAVSLLPGELSKIQWVDYVNRDSDAALGLARAFANATPSKPLREPLPTPPDVPLSYLGGLATRVAAPHLSYEEQAVLVVELKASLRDESSSPDAIALLERLKKRPDLLAKTGREIDDALQKTTSARQPPTRVPAARLVRIAGAVATLLLILFIVVRNDLFKTPVMPDDARQPRSPEALGAGGGNPAVENHVPETPVVPEPQHPTPAETRGVRESPPPVTSARNAPREAPPGTVIRGGLMWALKDNGQYIDWQEAGAYCDESTLAGFSDWQLPLVDQIRHLYDETAPEAPKVVKPFQLTGMGIWTQERQGSRDGFTFSFYDGKAVATALSYSRDERALCVRKLTP